MGSLSNEVLNLKDLNTLCLKINIQRSNFKLYKRYTRELSNDCQIKMVEIDETEGKNMRQKGIKKIGR